MATYPVDIWNAGVPVLLIGGSPEFEIWNAGVPFVQETETAETTIVFQALGESTATVILQSIAQVSAQANGDSTATVVFSGDGFLGILASASSAAAISLSGSGAFAILAAGESTASLSITGDALIALAPFAGDSIATINGISGVPFIYPPTLILGF